MPYPATLRLRRAALLLLVPLVVAACDFSGLENISEEKYGLLIELEEIETPLLVRVYDAATGELVRHEVTLTIGGQDAGTVVDAYSDPTASFTFGDGRMAFGIRNGVTPTKAAPVRFTIGASARGYLATSQNVRVTATGEHIVDVPLIHPNRPPAGTAVQQNATPTAGGATSQAVTVATTANAGTRAGASATVPAGTVFTTASGVPLNGTLTTTLTYFDSGSERALKSLPGAQNALAVVDGGTAPAALRAAGAVTLQIRDAEGRTAARAEGAIDLALEIAPGAVNPRTGAPYAAGETISLWSFDAAQGAWTKIGSAVLTAADGGRLGVRVPTSAGKLGGGYVGGPIVAGSVAAGASADDVGATCEPTFTFRRNGNAGLLPVRISGATVGSTTLADDAAAWTPDDAFLATDVVDVTVYRPEGKQTFENVRPCADPTTFDLTPATTDVITMDASATLTCEDPGKKIIVSDANFLLTYERQSPDGDAYVPVLIPTSKVQKSFENNRLSGLSISLHGLVAGARYDLAGTILDVSVEHADTAERTRTFDLVIDHADVCQ